MVKALIKLGYSCNNNCLFCHAKRFGDASLTAAAAVKKIKVAAGLGAKMVFLSGGEATIRKDFPELTSAIRKAGMECGVITNGRMFSSEDFAKKNRVEEAFVSLHSHRKEIHDKLSADESFLQTVQGIRNLVGLGSKVSVNCVVNRQNYQDLQGLIDLSFGLGALKVRLMNLCYNGKLDMQEVGLGLREAGKAALAAAIANKNIGLEGFPHCLIGFRRELVDNLMTNEIVLMSEAGEEGFFQTDYGPRIKTAKCEGCKAFNECPGIDEEYYKAFGDSELKRSIS